jgi:hypothetical protein
MRGRPATTMEGADGHAPSEVVFHLPDSVVSPAGDQDVAILEAKLSRLLFL